MAFKPPLICRDLAIVVPEAVPVQGLLHTIRTGTKDLLTGLAVSDIYRGRGIEEGFKSVAIGLNLQDISRTLTDEEINAVVAQVVAGLEREHSATIRSK